MGLNPDFPTDPHAILDPDIRWNPGEEKYSEDGYATLLPPLVYEIRKKVKSWRAGGYAGASNTTRALLNHWFNSEHLLPREDGNVHPFGIRGTHHRFSLAVGLLSLSTGSWFGCRAS
jgi:type III restriction enzyme